MWKQATCKCHFLINCYPQTHCVSFVRNSTDIFKKTTFNSLRFETMFSPIWRGFYVLTFVHWKTRKLFRYLRYGGYVLPGVCPFVCPFVCYQLHLKMLIGTLWKFYKRCIFERGNFRSPPHLDPDIEIFGELLNITLFHNFGSYVWKTDRIFTKILRQNYSLLKAFDYEIFHKGNWLFK